MKHKPMQKEAFIQFERETVHAFINEVTFEESVEWLPTRLTTSSDR